MLTVSQDYLHLQDSEGCSVQDSPISWKFSQSYGFSSSHVQIWELDHKEGWAAKNWCFQTLVLKKTLESPLDGKGDQTSPPKGNQPWIFIGRTDAEAPTLCHLLQKACSLEKTLMLRKIEARRKEWQRVRRLDGIPDSVDMNLSKVQEKMKNREAWNAAVHGVTKSRTRLRDRTTTTNVQ